MALKPILADYLMAISIVLFLGCHIATNYLIWHINGVASQIGAAEDLGIEFEANPISRYIFQIQSIKVVYSYVFMPGLLFGVYYLVRRKGILESTTAFAIAMVVMAFSNFLNDGIILLAILT